VKFVSNRDIVVRSLHGHAIEFKKGVPTDVPRVMHSECLEKGILPVEGSDANEVIKDPAGPVLAPEDALEREDAIVKVIEAMVKRNVPSDFTGGGHPNAEAVSASLGWKTDQKEVKDVWVKNRERLILAKDKDKKQ
jgi:hypothetical protein